MVPKPQQQQDDNYTNTLVQPVHPAKTNILSAYKITGYTVVIFVVSHSLEKVYLDVSEKCTACVLGK